MNKNLFIKKVLNNFIRLFLVQSLFEEIIGKFYD